MIVGQLRLARESPSRPWGKPLRGSEKKKEYYYGRSSERFFVMMMSKLVRIGGEVILRLLNASMVKNFVDYVYKNN